MQLSLNSYGAGSSIPSSAFLGSCLKKVNNTRVPYQKIVSAGNLRITAESDEEEKQSKTDKWRGLAYDISDDQQDITRGKGLVDTVFQAPSGTGTHNAIMSSYDYISTGLRQ